MKKTFLISIVAVASLYSTAQNNDTTLIQKKDSHAITVYGFARSEMFVNSRENYEAKGGVICLYPKPIELDDYGFDKNAKVNATFLAITSRIGLK